MIKKNKKWLSFGPHVFWCHNEHLMQARKVLPIFFLFFFFFEGKSVGLPTGMQ
jgi:hypothetical protein